MENLLARKLTEDEEAAISLVDAVTRARIGSLCAHGLSDIAIGEMLILDTEIVMLCHGTEEFKKKYAEITAEEIDKQIDLDEGWDAVETAGIAQVLTTLQYNRDPKYALAAAAMANKAARRKTTRSPNNQTIDASKNEGGNIILLTMNKTYIANVTQGGNRELPIQPKQIDGNVVSRSDIPTPKTINEMLAPVQAKAKDKLGEMEELFKAAGVVFDKDE